jgi:hypothetical protein
MKEGVLELLPRRDPAEAGRSIICGMVKSFIQPVRRPRGEIGQTLT